MILPQRALSWPSIKSVLTAVTLFPYSAVFLPTTHHYQTQYYLKTFFPASMQTVILFVTPCSWVPFQCLFQSFAHFSIAPPPSSILSSLYIQDINHYPVGVLQIDLPNLDFLLIFFFFSFWGLSHLVAASFTEDRFGVVQTTLPAILNTLLTLQEVGSIWVWERWCLSLPPRFFVCFL